MCIRGNSTQNVDTTLKKKIVQNIVLNEARWSRRHYWLLALLSDRGLLTKSKVDERPYMFACRHSNRLSSTLEQRIIISSALMLHFFYPPCTSRENWDRWRDIFARRHANRLSLGRQQHQQVSSGKTLDLLLSAPYVTRNLGGDEHGLFVVDEDFLSYVCARHACGRVHSIFCCPGSGLHTHLL